MGGKGEEVKEEEVEEEEEGKVVFIARCEGGQDRDRW